MALAVISRVSDAQHETDETCICMHVYYAFLDAHSSDVSWGLGMHGLV